MTGGLRIKICGITRAADAEACVAAGADMLGLNFVPGSPRRVSALAAQAIAAAVRGKIAIVGVVASEDLEALRRLAAEVGLDRLQLHGDEPPELVAALGPLAFKAIRVAGPEDIELAARYPGEPILLDAKVEGLLGGTGHPVPTALVAPLARTRAVLLAGGLGPENVAAAVRAVRPWGVDVASGVESRPGEKDVAKLAAFVAAARAA